MYSILKSTRSKQRETKTVTKSDIQKGHDFIDAVTLNYPNEVKAILTESTGKDHSMISTEMLKKAIYDAIKTHNPILIRGLSKLVIDKENTRGFGDSIVSITPIETKLSATGRQFDTNYTAEDAKKYLIEVKGFIPQAATDIINEIGADATELDGFFAMKNPSKEGVDWNKALDTTGKVAQSIFYLGSLFQQSDAQQNPTIQDSNVNMNQTKSNTTRNVIVISVVVFVIVVTAFVLLRRKKSEA